MTLLPAAFNISPQHAIQVPGGVLGYKRDGGGLTESYILHQKKYMDHILCTQKNTRLEILDPKKYKCKLRPAMKVNVLAKIPMIGPMISLSNR